MIFPENFENIIGFDVIRQQIVELCRLESSKLKGETFNMNSDVELIEQELGLIFECDKILEVAPSVFNWVGVSDVTPFLKYVDVDGYFLIENQWVAILNIIHFQGKLANFLSDKSEIHPLFFELFRNQTNLNELESAIKTVIDDEGEIRVNASADYQKLSNELNRLEKEIRSLTKGVFREWKNLGYTADTDITVREEKLVIPILAEYKRKVSGFVKDVSATGKVLFVEPSQTLEMNNRWKEVIAQKRRERERILKQLTLGLKPFTNVLISVNNTLTIADFIYAKNRFSHRIDGIRPKISKFNSINIRKAFHPVLKQQLTKENKKVIPLDIEFKDKKIVVVSGPNAGGKSVVLKTTLLLQYMVQCGLYIPAAEGSELGVFEFLGIDCGDGQSLESGLSTFSAHLANLKFILKNANDKTLVGLDELGTGTDPRFGAPIAQSVLEALLHKKSTVLATTHFSQIREWGGNINGVMQASMAYDALELKPLYRFVMGKPGSSFALELMRKTGFDASWINGIQKNAGEELGKTEDLMLDLEKKHQELETLIHANIKKQDHLDELKQEYSKLKEKLAVKRQDILLQTKRESEKILSKANQQIEQTIRIIRENSADSKSTKEAREDFNKNKESLLKGIDRKQQVVNDKSAEKEELKKVEEFIPVDFIPGAKVKSIVNGQNGEIIEVKKDKILVVFGLVKMWVPKSELSGYEKTNSKKSKNNSNQGFRWVDRKSSFSPTIDIRGMLVDEALSKITPWLDEGYVLGAGELKVIHGKGEGNLRRGVHSFLRTENRVKSWKSERMDQGGDGCTIIELN